MLKRYALQNEKAELSIIDKDFNLSKKDSKIIDSMEVLARRSIDLCGKKIKE